EYPDVIILDINMPGMDGHNALKEIKNHSPGLPVIMLTGHGEILSAKEARDGGAFDYLSKPCNIDVLSERITEAYKQGKKLKSPEEKRITDIMIPVREYAILSGDQSVKDAIMTLKASFTSGISTSCIIETGHCSVLVGNDEENIEGVLTIVDLLAAVMPPYLSSPTRSAEDSVRYSSMFWEGMFSRKVKEELGEMKISEVISPTPRRINGKSNLMTAAYMMLKNEVRRLLAEIDSKVVGVVREQDLFLEMEKLLKR
ncbi:response regulator, partial [Desulfococcaceae bacterium HSG8]|nr:response regulator [Desulfococcaceae bacterium HSG8]